VTPRFGFGPNDGSDNSEDENSPKKDQNNSAFPGMEELISQFQSFGFNPGALFSQMGAALGNPAAANSG